MEFLCTVVPNWESTKPILCSKKGYFEPWLHTLKVIQKPWAWSSNKYELDFLIEVLNINFGQEAAKISEVKVGGWKKYLPTRLPRVHGFEAGWLTDFFWAPTLNSCIFAASWPNTMFSTCFERSTSYLFGDRSSRILNDF